MSEIKVNNIQSLSGSHGPVISGTVEMNSTGAMSLPTGNTNYRGGRGRGLIGGGYVSGSPWKTISYITIASTGNATDFGDTTVKTQNMQGWGSSTRGFFAGGLSPGYRQNIDYVTVSETGNAFDFGDLSNNFQGAALSNEVRGIYGGGVSLISKIRSY